MSKNVFEENKKTIDSTNEEINLYFIINEIGGFIWRMNHDSHHFSNEEWINISKDIETMRNVQMYAISTLPRFGVNEPFQKDSKQGSGQYWAWFRWWDSYIKNMSDEEWKVLENKINNKEDFSNYRPEGDWKDNVETEEENIRKAKEFWGSVK